MPTVDSVSVCVSSANWAARLRFLVSVRLSGFALAVVSPVQPTNAGSYTVRVSNSLNFVVSLPAVLTVASGQFSAVTVGPNGVQLTAQGEVGGNYAIDVSSDLSDPANWQPLATLLNNPGTWQFTDTTAPGVTQRFYRLRKTP